MPDFRSPLLCLLSEGLWESITARKGLWAGGLKAIKAGLVGRGDDRGDFATQGIRKPGRP